LPRIIRCPRCKKEQALKPVCTGCGFDIRAHYTRKKQQQEAAGQGSGSPIPSKKIRCPSCKKVQPLHPICSECNYDIKTHVLKARQAARPEVGMAGPPKVERSSGPGLLSIEDLLSKSAEMYKRRALPVILVLLVGFLFTLAAAAITYGIGPMISEMLPDKRRVVLGIAWGLGSIAGAVAYFVTTGALAYSVTDESVGLRKALRNGWQRKWAFGWLVAAFGFITMGGFMLFFIPGVIMGTMFAFSFFILAKEDVRGMDAMLKSREYIRGRGWTVFLSLLVIWLVSSAVGGVPLIGPLLFIAFMPFMMFYIFILYENLRETAPPLEAFEGALTDKALCLLTGIVGNILGLTAVMYLLALALGH
jgi:hypothetical protein